MALLLSVINLAGCSSAGRPTASRAGGGTTSQSLRMSLAARTPSGSQGEFIFDGHTHHVMPTDPWVPEKRRRPYSSFWACCPQAAPTPTRSTASTKLPTSKTSSWEATPRWRFSPDVPNSGPATAAVPFNDAVSTPRMRRLSHGGAPRLLLHDLLSPNFGALQAQLEDMSAKTATGHVAAFKVYTAWGPNGRASRWMIRALDFP